MTQITPFLWFDHQADEAMAFYASVFPDSSIGHVERYPDESIDPHFAGMSGKVITGSFQLAGQRFLCLDGGPKFPINPSISFTCAYDDRAEVEAAWKRLGEGGSVLMELGTYPWSPAYGWVADRFGVNWQLALIDGEAPAQRITPTLMFTQAVAGQAERAMRDYTALFAGSGVDEVVPYTDGDADTPGLVKQGRFHLAGSHFVAMDSTAPHAFTFNEGVSLLVTCADQAEIDRYWDALTSGGGSESQCGWCKDRYGLSWQIVPDNMGELLAAGPAAVQAMMGMRRIDIAELERAGGTGAPR